MLRVHFLNVGHGDCTIIKHPSGRLTMIDVNNSQDFDPETFAEELAEEQRRQRARGTLLGGGLGGVGFGSAGILGEYFAVTERAKREELWAIIAANAVAFYCVAQWDSIATSGIGNLFKHAANLLPVGVTIILTTVANALISSDNKARLVFLRWHHALPGHRAFSVYAQSDPRVDVARVKRALGNKLPVDPAQQNQIWYRWLKETEKYPAVEQSHRDFLLLRDYTAFSILFFLGFGLASWLFVESLQARLLYTVALFAQFLIVRHAAATVGARFVCTVLAHKTST